MPQGNTCNRSTVGDYWTVFGTQEEPLCYKKMDFCSRFFDLLTSSSAKFKIAGSNPAVENVTESNPDKISTLQYDRNGNELKSS